MNIFRKFALLVLLVLIPAMLFAGMVSIGQPLSSTSNQGISQVRSFDSRLGFGSGLSMWQVGSATSIIAYDLKALFTGADQSLSGVIDTSAKGIETGSETVVGAGVEIDTNKLSITGTGTWDQTGLRNTTGSTKSLGKSILGKMTHNTAAASQFGLNTAAGIARATGISFEFTAADVLTVSKDDDGSAFVAVGAVVDGVEYSLLGFMGGFNVSENPYYTGQTKADYTYGIHWFIEGGTFTTYTHVWSAPTDNTGTLYRYSQVLEASPVLSDDFLIPTLELDPDVMIQPNFYDSFTGTNGDSLVSNHTPEVVVGSTGTGNPWESGADTWTIQGNAAVNDPGLEANVTVDPSFDAITEAEAGVGVTVKGKCYKILERTDIDYTADGSPNNNVGTYFNSTVGGSTIDGGGGNDRLNNVTLTNWAASSNGWGPEAVAGSLTNKAKKTATGSGGLSISQAGILVTGKIYKQTWVISNYVASILEMYFGTYYYGGLNSNGTHFRYGSSNSVDHKISSGSTGAFTVDDNTMEEVTLNEMFITDDLSIADGIFDINLTIPTTADGMAGLVIALDSDSLPANFVQTYYNRGTGKVEVWKCVAGTYTSLINTTATYVAGAQLRCILDYDSTGDILYLRVYYNGVLIGTMQIISDASIAGNTRHGIMSTSSSNSLDNFTVTKRTDTNWDTEINDDTGGIYPNFIFLFLFGWGFKKRYADDYKSDMKKVA